MPREPESRLAYSSNPDPPKPTKPKPAAPPPPAAGKGGIRLRLDRRASDRVVTVITGLPGSPADIAALAKLLKSACGTGGTVKDGALELQGDHREAVDSALAVRGLRSKRAGG